MPLISVTRLRLRSIWYLPQFLWINSLVNRQVVRTSGFLRGKLLADKRLTFWTTTAWTDVASMRAYRDSGPHKRAMPKLADWCSEATSVHWEQDSDQLPEWKQAHERLIRDGRVTYVKTPSADQKDRRFAEPSDSRIRQELRPRPQ
jgi:hypothetical protein